MGANREARKAIGRYEREGDAGIVRRLEATHMAFQFRIHDRVYALRQFNPYMDAEGLCVQFRLAQMLHRFGLKTSVPIPAEDGRFFVEVENRFWALFPWCNGRPGQGDRFEDLCALTSAQGTWIECCE